MCRRLNEIDDAILKPGNIKSDVSDSMGIMEPVHGILREITLKLENMRFKKSEQFSERCYKILNTKLTQIEFPVFKGNPLEWQSFYDQFNISIHQSKTLSNIDRFNYLRRYLVEPDLATISGLTLNSENYKETLNILIDR